MKTITAHKTLSFFRQLFGRCQEGYVPLKFFPSKEKVFVPLSDLETIPRILKKYRKQTAYFGMATRDTEKQGHRRISQIPALWARTHEPIDSMLQDLRANRLVPTAVLRWQKVSYVIWFLEKPASREHISFVNSLLLNLQFRFSTSKGIEDAARFLKVPGISAPNGKFVSLKSDLTLIYSITDFDAFQQKGSVNSKNGQVRDYMEKESGESRLLTVEDILKFSDPNDLIEGFLLQQNLCLLSGSPGAGKSVTSLEIAQSVLTGGDFAGKFKVLKTGPVLLVDEETPRPLLKDRIRRLGIKSPRFSCRHFHGVRIDDDEKFEELLEDIEEVKPVLFIIDSLTRVHQQNEQSANAISTMISRLRKIVNRGITVLLIHHHKKGNGPLSERARGSSDILASVDVHYAITMGKNNSLTLHTLKDRSKPLSAPIKLKIVSDATSLRVVYQGTGSGPEQRGQVKPDIAKILSQGKRFGVDDIHRILKKEGASIRKQSLRDDLNAAAEAGNLLEHRASRGKKIYELPPASQFPISKENRETEKLE